VLITRSFRKGRWWETLNKRIYMSLKNFPEDGSRRLLLNDSANLPGQWRHAMDELLVGCGVLTEVTMRSTVLLDVTPCSPVQVRRRSGSILRVEEQAKEGTSKMQESSSRLDDCSILKMEALCSLERSRNISRTTQRHIPEHNNL
jgi:hypothetical protein